MVFLRSKFVDDDIPESSLLGSRIGGSFRSLSDTRRDDLDEEDGDVATTVSDCIVF